MVIRNKMFTLMTYCHLNVNITCIHCNQQNGLKENFLQNGVGCMCLSVHIAFEALSLTLLETKTLYLLHIKLLRLLISTLIPILQLEQMNRKDTCLVKKSKSFSSSIIISFPVVQFLKV